MVRLFLCAVALASGAALSAAADDDIMAGYYGNSVVATGGVAETHTTYNTDHTFSMRVPQFGMEFKGKWQIDGDQICRNFNSPPPGITNPNCLPVAPHKVGDTWTLGGAQPRTFTLIKGNQ